MVIAHHYQKKKKEKEKKALRVRVKKEQLLHLHKKTLEKRLGCFVCKI